ncbi:hypothetical protein AALA44_00245 [Enterococcus ratti]|uniref:hypothetical protein n=1 Tax=Enterococcus ratti TaxID=150033 RepID=UPI003519AF83
MKRRGNDNKYSKFSTADDKLSPIAINYKHKNGDYRSVIVLPTNKFHRSLLKNYNHLLKTQRKLNERKKYSLKYLLNKAKNISINDQLNGTAKSVLRHYKIEYKQSR